MGDDSDLIDVQEKYWNQIALNKESLPPTVQLTTITLTETKQLFSNHIRWQDSVILTNGMTVTT